MLAARTLTQLLIRSEVLYEFDYRLAFCGKALAPSGEIRWLLPFLLDYLTRKLHGPTFQPFSNASSSEWYTEWRGTTFTLNESLCIFSPVFLFQEDQLCGRST